MTLHKPLIGYGVEQSRTDAKRDEWARDESFERIVVYGNDIQASSNSSKSLNLLIDYFKSSFEVSVEAEIQKFLGYSVYNRGSLIKRHDALMRARILEEHQMKG